MSDKQEIDPHQFRSLVEQARDGIFVSDHQGRFTYTNPSACEIMGYSPAEMLRRRSAVFFFQRRSDPKTRPGS